MILYFYIQKEVPLLALFFGDFNPGEETRSSDGMMVNNKPVSHIPCASIVFHLLLFFNLTLQSNSIIVHSRTEESLHSLSDLLDKKKAPNYTHTAFSKQH